MQLKVQVRVQGAHAFWRYAAAQNTIEAQKRVCIPVGHADMVSNLDAATFGSAAFVYDLMSREIVLLPPQSFECPSRRGPHAACGQKWAILTTVMRRARKHV